MKNHRTLVTPPARGRRLRCTVPLLRARRRLAAALRHRHQPRRGRT